MLPLSRLVNKKNMDERAFQLSMTVSQKQQRPQTHRHTSTQNASSSCNLLLYLLLRYNNLLHLEVAFLEIQQKICGDTRTNFAQHSDQTHWGTQILH